MSRRSIFESLFGSLSSGDFCTCPGQSHHTNINAERDCRVYGLDGGAPSIFCLHTSCQGAVDDANYKLRRAIALAENPRASRRGSRPAPDHSPGWVPTKSRVSLIEENALELEEAALEAEDALPGILRDFRWDLSDTAPIPEDPEEQYLVCLRKFRPNDLLWIARNDESHAGARAIAPACSWAARGLTDRHQTSPWVFKGTSLGRCKDNAAFRAYLVHESDTLGKEAQLAVLNYIRKELSLPLEMVVFSGSRSWQGWIDAKGISAADMLELKAILTGARPVTQSPRNASKRGWHTGLQGDPAMFVPTQPVRLPGPLNPKTGNRQEIVWLRK